MSKSTCQLRSQAFGDYTSESSSSHIAFGSILMEAVFMILGQSTEIIAGMALEKDMNIHDLDYFEIKSRLIEAGQILNIK